SSGADADAANPYYCDRQAVSTGTGQMAQPASLLRLIGSERSDSGGSAPRSRPAPSRFSLAAFAACLASRYAPRMRPASGLLIAACAALAITGTRRRVRPVRRPL